MEKGNRIKISTREGEEQKCKLKIGLGLQLEAEPLLKSTPGDTET